MSGASSTFDPIAAAEADIAGSKDLIASVAHDLGQHERWLAHYQVAEKRHARRLMLQKLIYRLELGRQRLMRMLRRLAFTSRRLAHAGFTFLARTIAAITVILHRVTTAAIDWLRPRADALARIMRRWLVEVWAWAITTFRTVARTAQKAASVSFAWLAVQSRALAIALQKSLSTASSWTLVQAGALARASLKGASAGAAWSAERSRTLALSLRRRLSAGAARAGTKARALARVSLEAAAGGYSRAALKVRRLSFAGKRAERQTDTNHRALVVRRCTALICVEPRRARLPAIRAG